MMIWLGLIKNIWALVREPTDSSQSKWGQSQLIRMKRISIFAAFLILPVTLWASESKIYKGYIVIDPEVEIFQPCGSKKMLWLDYDSAMRSKLWVKYMGLKRKPYEETYAVLRGKPGPKLDCAFCEDYSGSFKVEAVIEHRRVKKGDCSN